MKPLPGDLALMLGGGGARSAYQAGVLRAIARRHPELNFPILTGVSAGAINVAHLANESGRFDECIENLIELWSSLDMSRVFEARAAMLGWRAIRVGLRLSIGVPASPTKLHGMVDTAPLREFLMKALGTRDGSLPAIQRNLQTGRTKAVALVTTRYDTGQTVTFYSGRDIVGWERPQRRSIETELTIDHIMASAALPLVFPAVPIEGNWYGDGGVRLVAPLAPARHLGATRILAISTRYDRTSAEADLSNFTGPPSPAQVIGVLFNAIFLDQLDQDALHMQRINELLRLRAAPERMNLREIGLLVIRPSVDLGAMANEFEPQLPGGFRYLTRRLGTKRSRSQDFLSTVMFQPDYIREVLALGERDGEDRADEIAAFLQGRDRDPPFGLDDRPS